ncbi:hypothetical protein [Qingshengfaniella alkalisoli]|uniref:Uncharacterized protein n=1 Tax=Qingshengfaniella alkalisoli TaxID=2599296 RepID=A0A5B8I843_9RHOB|nr:hypothetical protein [Qingshengfaniella alkalisoli]QDY68776.1 hypothetical protein FPZ52_03455 [Qingshengfaniella alkalisoli]
MSYLVKAAFAASGLLGLAACEESVEIYSDATPAETSCLSAVAAETNFGSVTLLGSEETTAGTNVMVSVGEENASWQCLITEDGAIAQVLNPDGESVSLTNP